MKKILVFMLCALMVCALPVVAFAEETVEETEAETEAETELLLQEASFGANGTYYPDPEYAGFSRVTINVPIDVVETTPVVPEETEEATVTEQIVAWVQEQFEEISVIITLILTVFYQVRKHGLLNKSIGTLNNNAVVVAEDSKTAIGKALADMEGVAAVVNGYKDEIASLLAEVRQNAEEKQRLESALTEVENYLKTAKLANVELANEVAELLVLANIPNSKKEELYSRHLAAVGAIADAEKTEVNTDDYGKEE